MAQRRESEVQHLDGMLIAVCGMCRTRDATSTLTTHLLNASDRSEGFAITVALCEECYDNCNHDPQEVLRQLTPEITLKDDPHDNN